MKEISFAWTTPALLAGRKTVTRRAWSDDYARRFRAGELVTALDRQRRYRGKPVAVIRLTQAPYFESTVKAPDTDWEAEGFEYLTGIGAKVDGHAPEALWRRWRWIGEDMWVVRFELVEVL